MSNWFKKQLNSSTIIDKPTPGHHLHPAHLLEEVSVTNNPPPTAHILSPTYSTDSFASRSDRSQSVASPSTSLSSINAPVAEPPEECAFVLSNLALYIFPPAIAIDLEPSVNDGSVSSNRTQLTRYFLVYTEYRRIALQDLLLVSLPYRMGITSHGSDFALRITDFALHLRDGTSNWLMAPKNGRSRLVESISDAYENLMGLHLEMNQVDYTTLIGDILSNRIWDEIRDLQIHRWANTVPIKSGYLFHRSIHVWPNHPSDHNVTDPSQIELKMSDPSDWEKKWFVLTADNFLLHFSSPRELEAFQFIVTAALRDQNGPSSNKVNSKLPATFDYGQIDLSKSLYLRGSSVCPDGFEIIVYPRSSSMRPSNDDANGNQSTLTHATAKLGYTRHIFQIPPSNEATSSTTKASTSGIHSSIFQVGSRHPALTPTPILATSSTLGDISRLGVSSAPSIDPQVHQWLKALSKATTGPGLQSPQGDHQPPTSITPPIETLFNSATPTKETQSQSSATINNALSPLIPPTVSPFPSITFKQFLVDTSTQLSQPSSSPEWPSP